MRDNAVLTLRALVHGNERGCAAAAAAGLVASLISQLDDGGDSEVALLAVQALVYTLHYSTVLYNYTTILLYYHAFILLYVYTTI